MWLYRVGADLAEEQIDPPLVNQEYAALKAAYDSERYYQKVAFVLSMGSDAEDRFYMMENLRSPAFEAVEFHASKWFPGALPEALPIDTSTKLSKAGRDAVYEVFKASNWNSRKQTFARTVAIKHGFIRVAQRESDGMPYLEVMRPQYVRAYKVDERGHLTYLRYAYPVGRGEGKDKKTLWKTEIFDKALGAKKVYEDRLPIDDESQTKKSPQFTTFASMGVDFVPIVWCPFTEAEPGLSKGVFEPHRDIIDIANREITRLDDMFFRYNRAVWALVSASITDVGAEIPPPRIEGTWDTAYTNLDEDERSARGYGSAASMRAPDGTLTLGSDPFLGLPAGWDLKNLVAQVDYQAGLQIIESHMSTLKNKMPELRYNDALESQARDSAKVLVLQLAGAIDRANEARANAEDAIIRAAQMAITVGQKGKDRSPKVRAIFEGLGDFESGDLDFRFKARPVIPPTPADDAAEQSAMAQAVAEKINVLRAAGLDVEVLHEEIAKLVGVDKGKLKVDAAQLLAGGEGGAEAGAGASAEGADQILKGILGGQGGGQASPSTGTSGSSGGGGPGGGTTGAPTRGGGRRS